MNPDCARLKTLKSWRWLNGSDGLTDLAAEGTPVMDCLSRPWPGLARQLHDVVLSCFGARVRAVQMLENLPTDVEGGNVDLPRFGESQSNERIVNGERLQCL